jgi:Carboxypeptidase regulatory-like domain
MVRVGLLRFCALYVFLSIAGTAFAQDAITISGTIRTRADGSPVPGAVVSVVSPGANLTATADASGKYTLEVRAPRICSRRFPIGIRRSIRSTASRPFPASPGSGSTDARFMRGWRGLSERATRDS